MRKGGKKFDGTEVLGENHRRLQGLKNESKKHKKIENTYQNKKKIYIYIIIIAAVTKPLPKYN